MTLARATFAVMRKDPELMIFPALSALFSTLFVILLFVPTVLVEVVGQTNSSIAGAVGVVELVLLFVTYFALSFASTFFSVAVVFTAKTRFEGGNATFFQALGFAASRTHQIVAWSLVSATVGVALRTMDHLADQNGIPGMIFSILRGLIGFAWSLVQLFVIPVMVYEDLGPFQAMKRSAEVLRETWGESLARHLGLGLLQFLTLVPIIGLFIAGFSALSVSGYLGAGVLLLAVVALALQIAFFNVANTVFNTALFHYAHTGHAPDGYEDDALGSAIGSR